MPPSETTTPAFVLWSLIHPCELRTQFADWEQPERTERTLRALQELSRAQAEQRVFEGFALHADVAQQCGNDQPPLAFAVDEVYEGFGGESFVRDLCGSCPANVVVDGKGLAGCFGMIYEWGAAELEQAFETILDQIELQAKTSEVFPATTPRFYGLWMPESYNRAQLELLQVIIAVFANEYSSPQTAALKAAIDASLKHDLTLRADFYPAGVLLGRSWTLATHCKDCRAVRDDSNKPCGVCGNRLPSHTPKRRNARGIRPYMNLADIIGETNVAVFLQRYFEKTPTA